MQSDSATPDNKGYRRDIWSHGTVQWWSTNCFEPLFVFRELSFFTGRGGRLFVGGEQEFFAHAEGADAPPLPVKNDSSLTLCGARNFTVAAMVLIT